MAAAGEGQGEDRRRRIDSKMKPGWNFLCWFAGAVCRRLIRWIENCLNAAVIVADALREGDIELLRVA